MGTGTWEETSDSAFLPLWVQTSGDAAAPHGCLTGAGPRAAAIVAFRRLDRLGVIRAFQKNPSRLLTSAPEGSRLHEENPCMGSSRDRGVVRNGS